jgi:hypothetical protein
MHQGRSIYRMLDDKSGPTPALAIDEGDTSATWRKALEWNEKQYGIFWTVNEFNSAVDRKKENLYRIKSWTADIDTGTKEEQINLIKKFPTPSLVVETKRGFQVYYDAIDAKPENYELIETKFVVPSLNADMKARDLSRILRVPHFYHWKDPSDPFFVKLVHMDESVAYTEAEMMRLFKDFSDDKKELARTKSVMKREFKNDSDLFERIWNMDCEAALQRLSGTDAVANDVFTFRQNSNGNKNIFANDKGTSCFIDRNGRIGSLDGGGPTVFQWLKWYGRSGVEAISIIKKHFPEVTK